MSRKSNGHGHTYKVGNSYRTVIRHQGLIVTAMAKTAQESRSKARSRLQQKPAPQPRSNGTADESLTLNAYMKPWLTNEHRHQIAASTYKRYLSIFNTHISPTLGEIQMDVLNSQHVNKLFISMQSNGLSPRSIQQTRALISVCLNEAVNLGHINANPVLKTRTPKLPVPNFTPLTIDEVKRVINFHKDTYLCARLHIALICGLRQGEALGLQWSNIDFDKGFLEVVNQIQYIDGEYRFTELKTSRSKRYVALTKETLSALEIHRNILNSLFKELNSKQSGLDLVFPNHNGKPRSPKVDYREWQKALKVCGIRPKRLHDARHTAATLMYSQGVGIETISRALGHSSSAITSRLYVHSAEAPLRKAAEALSELLGKE